MELSIYYQTFKWATPYSAVALLMSHYPTQSKSDFLMIHVQHQHNVYIITQDDDDDDDDVYHH